MQLFNGVAPSQAVQEQLQFEYVNLEATLLRAKVLRDFSKDQVVYIAQAKIDENDNNLGYLFAPFIIANLNQPVIYSTPVSMSILSILNQYYQAEKNLNLRIEEVIESLKLHIDLVDQVNTEQDFLFNRLIKALCRADVSQIFLITHLTLDTQQLKQLQKYLNVEIFVIKADRSENLIQDEMIHLRKLLFKNKDEMHKEVCGLYSNLNANLVSQTGNFNHSQAKHLTEDMFYSEHIFEKLSVMPSIYKPVFKMVQVIKPYPLPELNN